ncbi:hypothetical protein KAFR_0A08140 [Kazachstania africana CBS 2517]|uniref:Mitochondrial zinc maintenance protein 1, mitochondrial n=1 Tax=Kazachstania africana (strain ATCC 22294 / BCRC 22015 / CBS 2517 / CECT 1963 / NBRC 1671 / NRRL Y-8276) TaxID=1071382 RepID=H2APE8_KAZAF|nr:hypothetical protein KAFR_0A08140 [Kazachstania africana CBS 2517]CCF56248.1 hypothetical protein KAFR_0A08140 [Kazachstania africana CBS 2517]
MSNNLNKAALTAYRHGLRATRIAFKNDTRMLLASRNEMRQNMINPKEKYPHLTPAKRIQLLEDVAAFLLKNVVQGQKVDENVFHLNIHKDTELGDNESTKTSCKKH